MNILYASFDSVQAPKGASTHIVEFVRALAAQVGNVTLMTLPPAEGFGRLDAAGIDHRVVDAREGNFLDRAMHFRDAVDDEARAAAYDLIHFRSIWEGLPAIAVAARRGAPTVYEVNGLPSIELKYHYPDVGRRPGLVGKLRQEEALVARSADCVITPCAVTRDLLRSMDVDSRRIHVIPNGVDADRFRPGDEPSSSEGPAQLLYMGTLAPWQGVDTLLAAMKKLLRERDARLTLIGSGRRSWLKQSQKLARRLHVEAHVRFVPALPHDAMPHAIRQAHVGVAPLTRTERNTRQGCCPLKVLEYMACAKPVVASRLPAVREIVEDRETGLLFKPNNANQLCHSLLELAGSPSLRQRLGRQARAAVVERFTWARACAQLVDVYRRALDREPPADLQPAAAPRGRGLAP